MCTASVSPSNACEALAERGFRDLDRDGAVEPCVSRAEHFDHPTFADGRDDFVGAEFGA